MFRRSSFSRSPSPEPGEKKHGSYSNSESIENRSTEKSEQRQTNDLRREMQLKNNDDFNGEVGSSGNEFSGLDNLSEKSLVDIIGKSTKDCEKGETRFLGVSDSGCYNSSLNNYEKTDDMFDSGEDNSGNIEENEERNTQFPSNPKYEGRLECEDEEGYYVSYIGEVIGNKYKVCSNSIGKGVFSSVVKCINLNTKSEVAIKIIRLNDMMKSAGEREFEMIKLLRGVPNVVQVQESFTHQGHFCIVFEWLSGTLKNCMNSLSKHNISKVRQLARQIFIGIKHIHDKGYIHTDIKPDNILVDSDRTNFKISDFGNAIKESEASPASYLVSRFYRPPEVIIGSLTPFGKSIDIWSIGCVLYECFTGNVLFKGRDNNDMIKLIIESRGNFPKKMLRQGIFSKDHFSSDFEKLRWKNQQNVTQFISNTKSSSTIFQSIYGNIQNKKGLFSDAEITLIKKLSNLVEKCLVIDPKKRISAKEALEHPFFSDSSP
ncbi:hypothetical protein FG386_002002 [Cryptosporidium ryanae]|uniref:uncharacterized protein n=1 Tax=Cryptosporidium ryanae TaxID=515981 RepID=UPI00351A1186|nr:hypothetical protein FG386_002002 [Cryptosporidium ryanae]